MVQCGAWWHSILRALSSSQDTKDCLGSSQDTKHSLGSSQDPKHSLPRSPKLGAELPSLLEQPLQQEHVEAVLDICKDTKELQSLLEQPLQQEHVEAVLDICIQRHLAAEDLCRLRVGSRSLQQLCSKRISAALLLRSVAATAQAAAPALPAAPAPSVITPDFVNFIKPPPPLAGEGNSIKALRWLLRQPAVTAAMLKKCSQQLLQIPGVPLAAAETLVAAGIRGQVTLQRLAAGAYNGYDGPVAWALAFADAGVPLQEWAAGLPAELRTIACGGNLTEEMLQDLNPARTADLLAVALSMAAPRTADGSPWHVSISRAAITSISSMFKRPACNTTVQLSAAAVEALLRLAVRLCSAPINTHFAANLLELLLSICWLPAADDLATGTLVELAYSAIQPQGRQPMLCAAPYFLQMLAPTEGDTKLTHGQLELLLSLLVGPAAAVAAEVYSKAMPRPHDCTILHWLCSQPGAAAAAARLGLL
uniref:Uncharacterized protein n=1 Tax=Tetradesmus obliquus TaxID=3088 RepID=A0A383VLE0_TETOB|eukprot:jgi/Sobl393_1/11862/SZX66345.1